MSKENKEKKCANDIYSTMNYKKLREENLQKTEELYKKLSNDYSINYSNYLTTQISATNNSSDATLKNNSDAAELKTKPIIKELNQKLIDIETTLLDNNKLIRQNINEQSTQLEEDQQEKITIEKKMTELEKFLKKANENSETGAYSILDLKTKYDHSTTWYYILLIMNIILFIVFIVVFYKKTF
jgi:hypothetical protein